MLAPSKKRLAQPDARGQQNFPQNLLSVAAEKNKFKP
jgi:hypothetical protein